ncbi:hypothetical protein HUN08_06910 [Gordonia sp. X0973]|uniref:hypothetical protein n=1 Tax=Gordonia sp. X0973 TaxID=2742602 RepID=UPI000F532793|nr:hypothetical protein [Gordonia sp. X0973]QKT06948.1 hypothetical protein HUN08_06910 [Gordonia sp. X0973]
MAKGIAATALTGGALALGTGMANAAPVHPKPAHPVYSKQAPVDPYRIVAGIAPGVTYTGDSKAGAAELRTPWGVVRTAQGRFSLADNGGRTVAGDPTIKALPEAKGAPVSATSTALGSPQLGAVRNQVDDSTSNKPLSEADKIALREASVSKVATNFGLAYGVGAMVGGVVGGVIGCPIGAVAMQVAVPIPLAGAVLGCAVGLGTFGTTGAILGGAAVATPVGIVSTVQQIQYLQSKGAL